MPSQTNTLRRERQRRLLPALRDAARRYAAIAGRHSLIRCVDGLTVDVLWERRNFEHLCGVWCDRPPEVIRAGRTTEAEYFLDMLHKGRLPAAAIHYADYRRALGKARALGDALAFDHTARLVVEPDRKGFAYYFGADMWCIGIDDDHDGHPVPSALCDGNVHYPKSLRGQSVSKRRREGTEPHVIDVIEII